MTVDKRLALITAGLEAFRTSGFAASRIGDIATAAHVGKGTVYEYFASKEALLLACCLHRCEENRAAIRNAFAARPDLAAAIPVSFSDHEPQPDLSGLDHPLDDLRTILVASITHLLSQSTDDCRMFLELFALARHHPDIESQARPAINRVLERWEGLMFLFLQAGIAKGHMRPHPDVMGICRMFSAIVDGLMLQRSWRHDESPAAIATRIADTFFALVRIP